MAHNAEQDDVKVQDQLFFHRFSIFLVAMAILIIVCFGIAFFAASNSPGSYNIGDPTAKLSVKTPLSPAGLQVVDNAGTHVSVSIPTKGTSVA